MLVLQILLTAVCGVFGADQPGLQEAAAALQPALISSARTGPCTEDEHCGDHGVCLIDEGSCFCDLGFSGRTCVDPSVQGTVRGSSDSNFWTNLTLGSVRTGGGGGGGGGGTGSPMVGLLGGPTATANNWFNPFAASAGAYNPFAAAAAAAKAASRSVINPFAAPHGAVSFLGAPTVSTSSTGTVPPSPWGASPQSAQEAGR